MMTNKFKKMCEIYKIFAEQWDCDFSQEAMQEMYDFETYGKGSIEITGFNTTGKKPNGYAVGKKWLNVQVKYWLKDFKDNWAFGVMCIQEIYYKDAKFPKWWLDQIFKEEYYQELLNVKI